MNIDDEDKKLFRSAVAGIKPVHGDRNNARPVRHITEAKTRPASPGLTQSPEEISIGDILQYLRPGMDPRLLKKLRQGKIPHQATLDLHGCTQTGANRLLQTFVSECRQEDIGCILIIHGKGWRSKGLRPVLKTFLNQRLRQLPQVLAFCSAKAAHGGSGALYVLLSED